MKKFTSKITNRIVTALRRFKYKIYFLMWKRKIIYCLNIFKSFGVIDFDFKDNINDFFSKNKWPSINEFVIDFRKTFIIIKEDQYLSLVDNFLFYVFYELTYRAFKKQIKLPFFKMQPYSNKTQNVIPTNNLKRSYYYNFLDQIRTYPFFDNQKIILVLRKIK